MFFSVEDMPVEIDLARTIKCFIEQFTIKDFDSMPLLVLPSKN